MGGSMGPSLLSTQAVALTDADLADMIRDGRPDKGMPALDYQPGQIVALVNFIRRLQRDQGTTDAGLPQEGTAVAPSAIDRGQALFTGAARCAECHSVNEEGGLTAPDLTHIADRMTPEQLLDAIQKPSQSIADGYAASEIVMRDGTTIRGWSRYETAATLQLYDPQEQLWTTYFQKDLVQRRRLSESLMPNGLLDSLTDVERNNLLAFLASLKAEAN
jgi:putative heme-binding domain-containing protein